MFSKNQNNYFFLLFPLLLFWFSLLLSLINSNNNFIVVQACGTESCPKNYNHNKLYIHLIPHAHEDVGWLSTPDGYYDDAVRPMLQSVTDELYKNSNRRFTLVEVYYIKRWWQQQSAQVRTRFSSLVKNGQFQFANGGWCSNDEAAAHYQDIIGQLTLGINFIRKEFGQCAVPTVSWNIDSFGHSREMANLYARMDFEGVVTNRGPSTLHDEFIWNASSLPGGQIFTTHIHDYNAPNGFDFQNSNNHLTDSNQNQKAEEIIRIGREWNQAYGSKGHIMILMGGDNQYTQADQWYSNIDRLIEVVKRGQHSNEVELIYSTPTCYVQAVKEAIKRRSLKLDVRSQDYHPFWTGFYTSRPIVKYLDRFSNNLLQAAKQLEVMSLLTNTRALIYEADNQMAVLQVIIIIKMIQILFLIWIYFYINHIAS